MRLTSLRLLTAAALTAGVLSAAPSQAAPSAGLLSSGSYIVTLAPGVPVSGLLQQVTGVLGGQVGHVYSHALNGFSVRLPAAAAGALSALPGVVAVEPDRVLTVDGTQPNPPSYGLDRVDQRALPLSRSFTTTATGAGVTAYVIDTGIRTSHVDFGGRAVSGFDAVDGGTADDCNGHGTHVAGTTGGNAYGVAKSVRLVAVRVLDCAGSGATSGVIAGVDWVTGNHAAGAPAVANMSLGGGSSAALDQAVARSIADGVTYAVAAGNDGGGLQDFLGQSNACNGSPAKVPAALTVGATDANDNRASYSNIGRCLDLFAPGSAIASAWSTGDTATNTISGTSMATPHVAGVAALYLQGNPSASPATVASAIVGGATTGVVKAPGSGSPNRLLFSSY